MELLLKIVAAIVVVLGVGFIVVRWWLRRWIGRTIGEYQAAAGLVGDRYSQPARIYLQFSTDDEHGEEFDALWTRCHALGFRHLADFSGRDGEPRLLRAAAHASLPYAAAIIDGEHPGWLLLALAEDQRLLVLGSLPVEAVRAGTLDWQPSVDETLEQAFERMRDCTASRTLRPFDAALFRHVYERAHARRMDALLARPPTRETFERAAAALQPPAPPAQVERALELATGLWRGHVEEAVLDQFRELSRINAGEWERLRGELHVVHAHLDTATIAGLLVEDARDQPLLNQLVAQGLDGIDLYRELARRLPAPRRRKLLREVRVPLRALVFAPSDELPTAASGGLHHFEAQDADGRTVAGGVIAEHAADAKRQLEAMGLSQPRVVIEPMPLADAVPEFMLDPTIAAQAARAARESLGMAMLRALHGNLLLWLPPAVLLGWNLYQGPPFGWGDYLGFAYAALAAAAMLFLIGPAVLYNLLLQSRLHARWARARLCLALLSRLNLFGGLTPNQLLLERCKLLAGQGRNVEALACWRQAESRMSAAEFATGIAQLHDADGDTAALIDAQRRIAELQAGDLPKIDLALSLARYRDADEAEALLTTIDPQALSELALSGFQFARGLLAARRQQHAQAIRHYQNAIEQAAQFRSNPLVLALLTEINGYVALSMKQSGQRDQADQLWRTLRPLLGKHPSCRGLIEAYEDVVIA